MMPLIHPWTNWQEDDINSNDLYAWKWKEDTPEEIIKQYEEWEKYYNKKMKIQHLLNVGAFIIERRC